MIRLLRRLLAALVLSLAAAPAAYAQGGLEPQTPTPAPDLGPEIEGLATPDGPAENERRYFDAEDFRARFENRTVHLALGAQHYGSEQYLPGDRTVWIYRDGRCQNGDWFFGEGQFCFQYDSSDLSCWRVFEAGGGLYAETADRALLLRIYKIEETPLACRPDLVTEAPAMLRRIGWRPGE